MKILLYSINYAPELTGIGKYNGELASEFKCRGIQTHVVTAQPYYPEWRRHKGFANWWTKKLEEGGAIVYRCPLYVPKNMTTLKRLFHLFSFAFSSLLRLMTLLKLKPDVLFLVQPTLFCAPAALLYCKLTGAKAVMHIQDFEVEAMFGLGLMTKGKSARIAKFIECWLMGRFDTVSTISYSMMEKVISKGVCEDKVIYFPNWSDTEFVTPAVDGSRLKAEWGFRPNDKIVLYSGNIGNKQGLEVVLYAAKKLELHKELKFLFVGDGVYADTLKSMAKEQQLENVFFMPLQPWKRVPEMLALADIHLVVQKKGVADAMMPSKLTNILSVGGYALVTAEANTELGTVAEKFPGIYTRVEPENTDAFIAGLQDCLNIDTQQTNEIARSYAVDYLDTEFVISRFLVDLQRVVKK